MRRLARDGDGPCRRAGRRDGLRRPVRATGGVATHPALRDERGIATRPELGDDRGITTRPEFRDERGIVTTEFAFGAGVLILPVVLLVLSIPVWVERQSTARVAAQEAAREAVLAADPAAATAAGRGVVDEIASNLGLDPGALEVCFSVHALDTPPEGCDGSVAALPRGAAVTARVSVPLPLLNFPLLGSAFEATTYTASHTERVDEYRSFEP